MKPTGQDVDRLLPLLTAGDRMAFLTLREETMGLVLMCIRRYLRNECDVEEVAADTFIRVHRKISTFRGESSLATWIFRIAENLARNRYWYWKRRGRGVTYSLDYPMGDSPETTFADVTPDPRGDNRQEVEVAELESAIERNLAKLPDKQREILTILIREHLSYEELAARLSISGGTVKSRVSRARSMLREAMADEQRQYAA